MDKTKFLELQEKYKLLIRRHEESLQKCCDDLNELRDNYVNDTFKKSGHFIGQIMVDRECRRWYVSGAFIMDGDVYLTFNFAKKDGTMSKVSGMGRGMPHIKIS